MASLPLYRLDFDRHPGKANQYPEHYHQVGEARVDDELLGQLLAMPPRCWQLQVSSHTSYARFLTQPGPKKLHHYLHQVVYELAYGPISEGFEVDHRDNNGLNCIADNLRAATRKQQQQHQRKRRTINGSPLLSRWKGSYFNKSKPPSRPWLASIRPPGGKTLNLGQFASDIEGAHAYNVASGILQGPYSIPNDLPPGSLSPGREAEIEIAVRRRLARFGFGSDATPGGPDSRSLP